MTLDEARAIVNRWDRRKPGEYEAVLEADRLLLQEWKKRPPRHALRYHADD